MWPALLCGIVCASPSPFVTPAKGTTREGLWQLDEIELAEGERGEAYVLRLVPFRDAWTLECRTARGLVRVPLADVARAHLCDGTRIERASEPLHDSAVTVDGAKMAARLKAGTRQKDDVFEWRVDRGVRGAFFREIRLREGWVIRPGYARMVPGWGWRRATIGKTLDEIERLLGAAPGAQGAGWARYELGAAVVQLRYREGRVWSVWVEREAGVPLLSGHTYGAALNEIVTAYGQPERTLVCQAAGGAPGTLYVVGTAQRYVSPDGALMLTFKGEGLDSIVVLAQADTRLDSLLAPSPD